MADAIDPELLKLAEQIRRTEHTFQKIGAFDTWTTAIDCDGFLEGSLEDWPSWIQDAILKAVERQCIPKDGESTRVVVAKCYRDAPDEPAYIAVVVQAFPNLVH